jgi:hypothetical protein
MMGNGNRGVKGQVKGRDLKHHAFKRCITKNCEVRVGMPPYERVDEAKALRGGNGVPNPGKVRDDGLV